MVSEEMEEKSAKLGQAGPSWAKLGQAGSSWAKLSQAGLSWAKTMAKEAKGKRNNRKQGPCPKWKIFCPKWVK